jgi:L-threonylcarbamoyladenylate synthase
MGLQQPHRGFGGAAGKTAVALAAMSFPAHSEIQTAAEILCSGGLVAFPTETVYGLGADADNEAAVRQIFTAKGRPADHPVIVHLAKARDISLWAEEIPSAAWQLAETCWPGPLTLVLTRSSRAKDVVTGGLNTVGLRVPSHPVARALLLEFGGAIAAPSANRFGRVSPTTAEHVRTEFGDNVAMILDGGACEVGLESTIVDFSGKQPVILRPGAITNQQVEEICGPLLAPETSQTRCSGRLESHYAPRAIVEVVAEEDLALRAAELTREGKRVAVLGSSSLVLPAEVKRIPWGVDHVEQAQFLYAALRRVDELECDVALACIPAPQGLGAAILDRLQKAAGPRS